MSTICQHVVAIGFTYTVKIIANGHHESCFRAYAGQWCGTVNLTSFNRVTVLNFQDITENTKLTGSRVISSFL